MIVLVGGIPTPLKNDGVRQVGVLFPTEWTNKSHVPNHQPNIYIYIYIRIYCIYVYIIGWMIYP